MRRLLLPALLASLSATASAQALTLSPSGSYTLTGTGSFSSTFASNGQTLGCTSSSFALDLSSAGTGSSPNGSALIRGCSDALFGARSTAQTSAWSATVSLSAGSPLSLAIAFTIPAGGLTVTYGGGGACTYSMSGGFTISRGYAALPAAVTTTDAFSITSSALVVDSASNCSPLLVVVGLRLTLSATLSFNRAMTVSG